MKTTPCAPPSHTAGTRLLSLLLLAALPLSGVSAQTKPATRPASRPASRPVAQRPPAPVAPSPELEAMWKDLEGKREEALKLAKEVEKGDKLAQATRNRKELVALTKKFNEMLAPVAAGSNVRYAPGVVQPKTGLGKAIWLYKAARAVEAYNESKKSEMSDSEYGVFPILNEYREALGLLPLEYDLRLRDAARGHCAWMRERDTLDHESDKPGYKTPDQRISKEGYEWRGCAENIASGQRNSLEVFMGWFDSPGHHHNLVGDYVHLGMGHEGDYWCQNFAKGEPARAALPVRK